ncbi:MAG: hypothetical protein R3Y27_07700 [Clostridia bacterium]
MKKISNFFENIQSETAKAICVAIIFIALFASGNLIGSITNINFVEVTTTNNAIIVDITGGAEVTTTAATVTTTALSDYVADTDTLTTFATESTTQSSAPSTTQEILEYFNTSVNAVKTNASSVTKNYNLLSQDPERLSVPSIAESIADPIINQFVVDDLEAVTYATTEEIVASFPIAGESGTVNVQASDVSAATIQDNGTTYTVVLNFYDCTNPSVGSQIGSAFTIIKLEDVTEAVSMLESCDLDYYDCSITATIDKETGNLIEIDYYMPVVYNVVVSVIITTVEASVGIITDTNYSITY